MKTSTLSSTVSTNFFVITRRRGAAAASTTAFFGPEATSPPARLSCMLPGAAGQTSSIAPGEEMLQEARSTRQEKANENNRRLTAAQESCSKQCRVLGALGSRSLQSRI